MMKCIVIAFVLVCFGYISAYTNAQTSDQSVSEAVSTSTTQLPPIGFNIEELTSATDDIPGDFVVGPGRTELTLKPGETGVAELIVSNRTGVDKIFKFEIEDIAGTNNPEQPLILLGSDRGPYTIKDYITLPSERIDLKHNQRARIPVTITVPIDAEPGGRYGTVLVTTATKDVIKNAPAGTAPASVIVSRVGSHFFLTIEGDTNVAGELQDFSTLPHKRFFTEGPIHFQLLYQNKGNLHLNPYGEIRIKNMLDEEVGFVELDPWFALPNSLRSREIEWNREILMGKYTATAQINRGYEDIIDTKTITFWIIPWKVVATVFGSLLLVFFILRFFIKNFEFKRKGD